MIRCLPIPSCAHCPYAERHYGRIECAKFNHTQLPEGLRSSNGVYDEPPDWCPLPPHPSFRTAQESRGESNG